MALYNVKKAGLFSLWLFLLITLFYNGCGASKKTGALNVRIGMPDLVGQFPKVIDVLKPGSSVQISEVKEWYETGYKWAHIKYGAVVRVQLIRNDMVIALQKNLCERAEWRQIFS